MNLRRLFPTALVAAAFFALPALAQTAPVPPFSCTTGETSCWNPRPDSPLAGDVAIFGDGSNSGASTNVFQDLNPDVPGSALYSGSNYILGDHNSLAATNANNTVIGSGNSASGVLGDLFVSGYNNTIQSDDGNIFVTGENNSVVGTQGKNLGVAVVGGSNTSDTSSGSMVGVGNYLLSATSGNIFGYWNTIDHSTDSSVLGNFNYLAGNDAVIAGTGSSNTADDGAVFGSGASNSANAGTVLGSGASLGADATNSVALGAGTTTDDADVVAVGGRRIEQLTPGVAPTDAVNVSQLDDALLSAKQYTDLRSTDVLNQANQYTDMRVGQLNVRINYALAAAAAGANAAAAVAGQDPTHKNRVALADGLASGVNAWTFMYQHKNDNGMTWNVSLTGEQGGGSSAERQVGAGVGYSW